MGNGAVKTIVLVMVLVVLSVLIGAQVSDDVNASIGAFLTIGSIVGFFMLLACGTSSWRLIFLLPPLAYLIPGLLVGDLPIQPLLGIGVGIYWLILWVMGYARFTWHSLPALDFFVLAIFIYMVVSFYRYPVAIAALGIDYDYVGGREYFYAFFVSVYYLVLSSLPLKLEEYIKCLKWAFFLSLTMAIYVAFRGILHPSAAVEEAGGAGEVLVSGRFSYFAAVGTTIALWVYGKYPMSKILFSLRNMSLLLLGCLGVILSGWRTYIVFLGVNVSFLALLKREILTLLVCVMGLYGSVLALGATGSLTDIPYGVQRVLTVVPGLNLSQKATADTKGSSDIRKKMWMRALDPRTGLIKDYIFGDGFQTSLSFMEREDTAFKRGIQRNQQEYLENHGAWHNGWVTYLHRLGIVGLVLLQLFLLLATVYFFQVSRVLLRMKDGIYVYLALVAFLNVSFTSSFLVWGVYKVFLAYTQIAPLKVLYCLMRDRGMLSPLFSRKHYVPLLIRDLEAQKNIVPGH